MSDTEIRMMRYTIEQLSAELQAKRQYVSEIETKLDRTRKALDVARNGLEYIFGYENVPEYVVKHIRQVLNQIKNATALEQITALEQKDVK